MHSLGRLLVLTQLAFVQKSGLVAIISQPRGKLSTGTYMWIVTIISKEKTNRQNKTWKSNPQMTHTKEPIWSCIAGCLVVSNTAWFHLSPRRLLLSEFVVELELLNGGFTATPPSLHSSLAVFLLWQHRKIRQMEVKPNASLHCQIFWLLLCLLFPNSVSCKWLDTWVGTE